MFKKLQPLRAEFARVEKQLDKATALVDALVEKMLAPEATGDASRWQELSKEHHEATERLEQISARWEEIALELEELEQQEA